IAKRVFQLHGVDAAGKAVLQRRLQRSEVLAFFKALPPWLVGIEACGTAHYWAREIREVGHEGAPAYLEKHPEPRSPADLAGHSCLLSPYPPFSDHWPFLDARGNTVIAPVSATLVATSLTVLRAAAIAGLGFWLSPPFIVSDLLAWRELAPLLRDYRLPEM